MTLKNLPFRKVRIVRKTDKVEYNENSPFNNWTHSEYEKKLCNIVANEMGKDFAFGEKYYKKYQDRLAKYRKTKKNPGKRMKLEHFKWYVVDASTDETIEGFDSIEQAKRFCIKNDYDFGLY
jgi:hypothetical protein